MLALGTFVDLRHWEVASRNVGLDSAASERRAVGLYSDGVATCRKDSEACRTRVGVQQGHTCNHDWRFDV